MWIYINLYNNILKYINLFYFKLNLIRINRINCKNYKKKEET